MADNSYISSGNNAELVRAVKDYALFLFGEDETYTKPTGVDWKPPAGKLPIGYNSEDGTTIHPEPGDETGIDQKERPIVIHAEKIKVSDRDDITLKSTDLLQYNMTLKTFKGSDGHQWHAWGMVVEPSASDSQTATAEASAEA